ncbi:MAG: hypothetical protein NVSMB48_11810 [Marmoricola sp.]
MSQTPGFSDEDLRAMTLEERRQLMVRLTELPGGRRGAHLDFRKIRRHRLALLVLGSIGLIPWTIYLGITLPDRYVVQDWTLTWTGFDVILTLMFAATAVLAFLRRQLVIVASFSSGVLLLCDAWFDLTTSHGDDRLQALGFALGVELPVGIFLVYAALQLLRATTERLLLDNTGPLWRAPLVAALPASTDRTAPQKATRASLNRTKP